MSEHVRNELGAYVLGALEPADRRAVEQHLDDCAACRDELSRLSVLPTLLDRLSPEEAHANHGEVAERLSRRVLQSAAQERRRLHRSVVRWRVAAGAAAAAAVVGGFVAWEPFDEPPDRIVVEVAAVEPATTRGTVAAYAWEWGTTVEVRVNGLPTAGHYELWAVGVDGSRERAGTWGPTANASALVRGACSIQRDALDRVEVTDPEGTPLFAANFSGS